MKAWVVPLTTGGLSASRPVNSGHAVLVGMFLKEDTLARGGRKGLTELQTTATTRQFGLFVPEDQQARRGVTITARIIDADHQEK